MIPRDNLSQIKLDELIAASNWQQQYKLIIQWGKLIQPKPAIRLPEYLVKGCELPVWLVHGTEEGKHWFAVDSDSSVMNGLAALVLVQLNGRSSVQIAAIDMTTRFAALGLEKHLTPSRNNGFRRILERALLLASDD